jgi:penicillin-binding protein 1C
MEKFPHLVRSKLKKFGRWLLAALVLLVLGGFFVSLLVQWVPLPSGLFQPPAPNVEFTDRQGRPLRQQFGERGFQAERIILSEVSPLFIQATLAAEDKRFWEHCGIDWQAIARAAWHLVQHGRVISGGSTITTQVIKLSQPRPRTLWTKIIEAAQALRLEQVWSKEQILREYLNRLDYGNRRIGCRAAAHYYFGKPPGELSLAEAAFMAGLPQAPTRLNPHLRFALARKRQQWILGRMQEEGWLTLPVFERAAREPLQLKEPARVFQAPHFVDLLMQLQTGLATRHGQTIRTTLDLPINLFAENVLRDRLARLTKQNVKNGALVVIENSTGHVLALVGSENYFAPESGQVNGAWAPRSAGSTFKPFTYLIALERGATPATVVADLPCEFTTPTGLFAPVNYNRQCYGPMRYRLALANSLNIPAVKVLQSLGGPAVLQTRLQQCGLTSLTHPPEHYGLGLTIGNAEARLLELANAYACLARLGEYRPLQLTLADANLAKGKSVFDADAAFLLADILSDNFARTLAFDLNSSLRFDFPVACKTGTSTDFRDNWAFGYTPEYTVGVWVGNFDGSPMQQVSGVTGAAPIMHEVMVHLRTRFGTTWYQASTNIVTHWIHPITGKRLTRPGVKAIQEKFLANNLPEMESSTDYDAQGRVRLASEYETWLAGGNNWLAGQAVADQETTNSVLRLLFPLPGTVLYLDPDLPGNGKKLVLKAQGKGFIHWNSPTLRCEVQNGQAIAWLKEGRHELTASDSSTGGQTNTWVTVKGL